MNIYGKVAIITNKLQEANIKKSGKTNMQDITILNLVISYHILIN